ncbi:4-hydroxy-tetrahydrodipicolinate reductase [Aliidiomarina taiwanensis]|uniref:4-hydroxy-tetrahydrodipicolinate reductase n=1 Tax=Aliidiomarina taiwanensis TaxID=946228 RepID=A0A432X959_9GAMM|nr:4-hydroxy-tetrahydrodipicolinate reductase [Aliidiomarina taiwanensis]RUO43856.1 4-hydroxy-tetrahydrodipicolinate reductase [Aliidiomarina taiwanensis]
MTTHKTKIAVVGASGRMGQEVVRSVLHADNVELVAALTHEQSTSLGLDVGMLANEGPCHVLLACDYASLQEADVVIDFATPAGCAERLSYYLEYQVPVVLCTTGLSQADMQACAKASVTLPLLYAENTSLGANALRILVQQASAMLGEEADIEILEAHHTGKQDAPSGTALALGKAAAEGRGQEFEQVAELHRNAAETAYKKGSIGFATLRAGDIIGEHTVYMVTKNERLEFTHRVSARSTFAEGAIFAARWLTRKNAGFYRMNDVLRVDACTRIP